MAPGNKLAAAANSKPLPEIHIHKQFSRVYAAEKKARNAGFTKSSSIQNEQRAKIAMNDTGRDFTILGPGGAKWAVPTHLATALSTRIKDCFVFDPPPTFFDMSHIPAIIIEKMIDHWFYGSYNLRLPHRFHHAENRNELNNNILHDVLDMPFATIHTAILHVAQQMGDAELMKSAYARLEQSLLDDGIEFSPFVTLIRTVFHKDVVNFNDDDQKVRLLLATFGAFWDPVWSQEQPERFEALMDDKKYGPFHERALKDLRKFTFKTPPAVESRLRAFDDDEAEELEEDEQQQEEDSEEEDSEEEESDHQNEE